MTTEPWMLQGACRGMNPDLWFAERGDTKHDNGNARAVCATCPVQDACLNYALRELINHGIWGGHDPRERQALRRRQRRLGSAA